MARTVRPADPDDLDLLLDLMGEFYAESNTPFNPRDGASAFSTLLDDPSLGKVWILQDETQAVGYVVLTLGFSMEYAGHDAFVDDLFIRPGSRRKGLGERGHGDGSF